MGVPAVIGCEKLCRVEISVYLGRLGVPTGFRSRVTVKPIGSADRGEFMEDQFVDKPYSGETEFAIEAVGIAAKVCSEIRGEMVTGVLKKADQSPVTVADFASQAIVARFLKDTYPQDPLIAEQIAELVRSEGFRKQRPGRPKGCT